MTQSPIKQRRRALRLRDYDYEQAGAYFVTICTQERACLFGVIQDDKICLNDAGRTIEKWWFELNRKFPMVETDEFVVMPNHFHGVVIITDVPVGADLRVGPVPEGEHPTQQKSDRAAARDDRTEDAKRPIAVGRVPERRRQDRQRRWRE